MSKTKAPKKLFSVSVLITEFDTNLGVKIKSSSFDDGCVGFMPCYCTREKAEKAWPKAEIKELKQTEDNDE